MRKYSEATVNALCGLALTLIFVAIFLFAAHVQFEKDLAHHRAVIGIGVEVTR
jgi:hypothetical protein